MLFGSQSYTVWAENVSIRLRGINARELSQPGGKEARDHLTARLPVGTVVSVSAVEEDKYGGRFDAAVEVDGHDLAAELVEQQWAAYWDGTGLAREHLSPWPRTVS